MYLYISCTKDCFFGQPVDNLLKLELLYMYVSYEIEKLQ